MTLFKYVSENFERIKFDIKIGLVSCTVLKHVQVYSKYDYYRRLGHPVGLSVMFVSEDLGVTEGWVYSIIKKMETEV